MAPASTSKSHLKTLRTLLLKTPALITFGLVAFYFVFGYAIFPPLAKWGAEKFIASKTGHALNLGEAKFDPLRLTLRLHNLKLDEPGGKNLLAFDELFVDFESKSLFKGAWTLADIRLSRPSVHVTLLPDGQLNWTPFLEAFKNEEEEEDKPLPRLFIEHITLQNGHIDFVDHKVPGGFKTRLDPLNFDLNELSTLPDDKGAYTFSTRSQAGTRIRWRGDLALNPMKANGEIAIDDIILARLWNYAEQKIAIAPPSGQATLSLGYRVAYADKHLALNLDNMAMRLEGLALQGEKSEQPAFKLDRLAISGGQFDLDKRQLDLAEIALNGVHIDVERRADGRLNIQDWFKAPGTPPEGAKAADSGVTSNADQLGKPAQKPTSQTTQNAAAPWNINLAQFSLDNLTAKVMDASFATPLTSEIGRLNLGFKAAARLGDGAPQVNIDAINVGIGDMQLRSGASKQPLFSLASLNLSDGNIDLAKRQAHIGKIQLSDGRTQIERDNSGKIALLSALEPRPGAANAKAAKPEADKSEDANASTAWTWGVDDIELSGFQVGVRDTSVQPALALDLRNIRASTRNVSQDLNAALPVNLALAVAQGGSFEAKGTVIPAKQTADLHLKLAALALKPAQPYIAQAAALKLDNGRVSSSGRLRVGKKLSYAGNISVNDLLLSESATGERFLSWKTLGTDDLNVTPDSVEIGTLNLDGLGAKVIINADKSTNLQKILHKSDMPANGEAKPVTPPPAKPSSDQDFKFAINSVKVNDGEMDFADFSLQLPFGTRIHQLKGYLNGIANTGKSLSQLELEGLVNDYGSARAVGQINLLDPTGFMDIKTVFRNVEMTNLTPYSATFAGRQIASGKLSLDLDYKIKDRQLAGENQVIMDKLTLGERVESPTAKNLPLDLAIAILSDSDGKIDLGLPVSGSLDDPQFSYGSIVWKAITNVLTKIVTAPFRALGKMLGISSEKMEKLAFDAGSDKLQGPERETLKLLAQALEKRPKLAITVKGTWDAEADRARIKDSRLRNAIAKGMGLKLADGEEAPPVSTATPKARDAIEELYEKRLGKDALKTLKGRYYKANPDKQEGMGKMLSKFTGLIKKDTPLTAEEQEALKGADMHALLYAQLLDKETVSDEVLIALAKSRGEAIAHELRVVHKVAPSRVNLEAPEKVEGDGKTVAVKLSLAVGKTAPIAEKTQPETPPTPQTAPQPGN